MSDPRAKRITDLQTISGADLKDPDLIEIVDQDGDKNGNPSSKAITANELSKFAAISGFDPFDQAPYSDRLDSNANNNSFENWTKFNGNGNIERNSGLVVLQVDEEVSSTKFDGEIAAFLWSHNSNTANASTSLFTSSASYFTATTGALSGATGNSGEITFSVEAVSDNKPPLYVENRRNNIINIRLHVI